MKKIFIASHCMELGGAERSLLGILNSIDYKNYEVDLFLYRHTGELLKYIPEEVNLLPEDKQMSMLAIPFSNVIKKGQFSMAWGRYKGKRKALEFDKENVNGQESMVMLEYSHKYTIPCVKRTINKTYDLAISFLTPHYYVAEKIDAKVKLAWIHTDYSKLDTDIELDLEMWDKYDYIFAVSEECKNSFLSKYPSLLNKVNVLENITAVDFIEKMANKEVKDFNTKKNEFNLLSVARFSPAKGIDNAVKALKVLHNRGLTNIKWNVVGYGGDEENIRKLIKENNLEDSFILLGKKTNPYPYMKKCDLYVQPSRYEGKAVTVVEAQILNKPVLITNYPTAKSQVKENYDGVICELSVEGIADGVEELFKNRMKLNALEDNCKKTNYSNSYELEKLYSLYR